MPKLRRLAGLDVIRIFEALGFEQVSTRGSHVKLRRLTADGSRQTLTIPMHREMDVGTLRAIYRQGLRYIPDGELRGYFFSD
jgi:predicted RNA binding protein YcfA (HicA-like mRNA interferase family)